ncbi:MAG TPA: Rieske 2Fe-2S domain-containing protein [bacterium]|nr:Rieske 2Fe-2S domain-containing protein [bacterium]
MAEATTNPAPNVGEKAHPPRPPAPITDPTHDNHIWARRSFLSLAGWGLFAGTVGVWATAGLRLMFPRVLFEPPSFFKAGFKADYAVGLVSEKYTPEWRVWIVNDEYDGVPQIYALIAICTHLGCTPRWLSLESKFKCPCHGSGYTKAGINFEGPAPRPLERAKIYIGDDGQIVVDKAVTYRWEKGEWGKPGSFLPA